jgi:2-methylcitrate dehydratase
LTDPRTENNKEEELADFKKVAADSGAKVRKTLGNNLKGEMMTKERTIAETIAAFCSALKYEDIPAETVHKAKGLILDTLGCALGGYSSEPAKIARMMAGRVCSCDLPARILGSGQQSSLEMATFANGVMIRFLDFNDGFQGKGGGHPSDNFGPIITCADALHVGGKEFILASVLAYEINCRMSDQFEVLRGGFDQCVNTVISGAMGAAKILGLSQDEMVQAVNLAITPNISLGQTRVGEVSMWKGAAAANAGRNAVFAALLAREGMTGPGPIFEGRYGFFKSITDPFEFPEFGGNGRPFRMMDASIKRYSCGQLAQTTIDAAIALRARIASVDEIAQINIGICARAKNIMAGDAEKWNPDTPESADHSMPYVVAIGLMYGILERRHFDEEFLRNAQLRALLPKIKVDVAEECDRLHPDACATKMEIVTESGKRFSEMVKYHKGHFRNPLTDEEIEQKFTSLAKDLLTPAQRKELTSLVWNLEQLDDIGRVFPLTRI